MDTQTMSEGDGATYMRIKSMGKFVLVVQLSSNGSNQVYLRKDETVWALTLPTTYSFVAGITSYSGYFVLIVAHTAPSSNLDDSEQAIVFLNPETRAFTVKHVGAFEGDGSTYKNIFDRIDPAVNESGMLVTAMGYYIQKSSSSTADSSGIWYSAQAIQLSTGDMSGNSWVRKASVNPLIGSGHPYPHGAVYQNGAFYSANRSKNIVKYDLSTDSWTLITDGMDAYFETFRQTASFMSDGTNFYCGNIDFDPNDNKFNPVLKITSAGSISIYEDLARWACTKGDFCIDDSDNTKYHAYRHAINSQVGPFYMGGVVI